MPLSRHSRQQRQRDLSEFCMGTEKVSRTISWQSVVITMESWWTIKGPISQLGAALRSLSFPVLAEPTVRTSSTGVMWREPKPRKSQFSRLICSLGSAFPALSLRDHEWAAAPSVSGGRPIPTLLHPVLKYTRQDSYSHTHNPELMKDNHRHQSSSAPWLKQEPKTIWVGCERSRDIDFPGKLEISDIFVHI